MAAFPDLQAPLRSSRFRDRHLNRRSEAWALTNTDSKPNRLSRLYKANRNHRLVELVLIPRSIEGALTGSGIDGEERLSFSVLGNVRPMIETVPLEQAADACARMMQGK
jgi:hypothetical protein